MTTIMPHSELVRKALFYIDERLADSPEAKVAPLLDEAGARFNLSPRDSEALLQLFKDARARKLGESPAIEQPDIHA